MFTQYREYGLALMPLATGTKRAIIDEWQKWSTELPTQEEAELWDKKYKSCGLVTGKASNIIAIDIDTVKPDVIASIPMSPVAKSGNPAYSTRFYRYNGSLNFNRHIMCGVDKDGELERVEILSDGSYTVMPPSVHPETKQPYYWLTPDTLPQFEDLPELTQADIDRIIAACSKYSVTGDASDGVELTGGPWTNTDPSRGSVTGSQARLRKLASGLILGMMSDEEVATKILDYDNVNHLPTGYFTEFGRTSDQKSKNPKDNALMFTMNIRRSINMKRLRDGETVLSGSDSAPLKVEVFTKEDKTESPIKDLPTPSGLIKVFYDGILKISPSPRPQFALSGALGLMSVLTANRFELNDIRTNLYIMNLGRTGSGKDAPRKFITRVLQHEKMRHHNLLGITKYVSAPATIIDLPKQRQRIDVIDEFSGFLKSLNQRESTIYNVATELTALWSINGGWYGGMKSIGRKEETGACYSPSISILGFCQPDTFLSNVTREVLDVGFLPRFLVFQAGDETSVNPDFLTTNVSAVIDSVVDDVVKFFKPAKDPHSTEGTKIILDGHVEATQMDVERVSKEIFMDMFMYYSEKTQKEQNEYTRAVTSRAFEQIVKISILTCLSDGRDVISKKDLDFSQALVETLISNSMFLAGQLTASNLRERNINKLISLLDDKKVLSMKDIHNSFKSLTGPQKKDLVQDLLDSGYAVRETTGKRQLITKVKNILE